MAVFAGGHIGEEGVLEGSARLVDRLLLEADAALLALSVAVVKVITVDKVLTFRCRLLLSW